MFTALSLIRDWVSVTVRWSELGLSVKWLAVMGASLPMLCDHRVLPGQPGHCNLTTWPPLDPQNLGTYFIPRILAVLLWMTSDVLVLCQLELVPGWSKSLHKSKHYVWKFQTFLSKSQGRKLIDGRFVHVRQEGIQEELLECNHSKL